MFIVCYHSNISRYILQFSLFILQLLSQTGHLRELHFFTRDCSPNLSNIRTKWITFIKLHVASHLFLKPSWWRLSFSSCLLSFPLLDVLSETSWNTQFFISHSKRYGLRYILVGWRRNIVFGNSMGYFWLSGEWCWIITENGAWNPTQ